MLQELDSLDLSRNQINGRIPKSLSWIDRIGYLDLSENDLSGKIPIGTQLQSVGPSSYGGNPLLCGLPLLRTCTEEEKGLGQTVLVNQDDKDGLITQGFYISLGLGFAIGFWGVFGTLLFNREDGGLEPIHRDWGGGGCGEKLQGGWVGYEGRDNGEGRKGR
ncbi:PREDICTED: LRR receptor [Prunus dulcis]|uniref:PREDICTED: LRR receptor n=1 Tax=Prunus dulcis TaxID=3755 RepID=A0A5E4F4Z4_PRUDU|nr:PREDICTED: LRR receptor [Prunus dulcis]